MSRSSSRRRRRTREQDEGCVAGRGLSGCVAAHPKAVIIADRKVDPERLLHVAVVCQHLPQPAGRRLPGGSARRRQRVKAQARGGGKGSRHRHGAGGTKCQGTGRGREGQRSRQKHGAGGTTGQGKGTGREGRVPGVQQSLGRGQGRAGQASTVFLGARCGRRGCVTGSTSSRSSRVTVSCWSDIIFCQSTFGREEGAAGRG